MIEVYDIGNENWDNHGNAVLKPLTGRVKMVAGGNYDLTMTHPIDPEGKWEHLVPGAVLRVPVPEERIENAFSGYAADIYKVTAAEAQVRENPVAPSAISYTTWTNGSSYAIGSKVSFLGKNYECEYWDPTSAQIHTPPNVCSWWKEIPTYTSGAAVLVTVQQGGELYFVEDVDSTWYKLSTYYGIVGYVKKSQVTFDRHLDPDEVKPRIIKDQLMRITGATVDTKARRVDVTAQHVSYDLNGTIVQEVAIAQASPAMAIGRMMENLMVPYRGTIATNLTSEDNGTYTDTIKGKSGMYCLLDPDKGIVGTFGAELHRDNWDLFIMAKTETDRGFRLRYRKNMLGVSWARKSDSLINRVVPVAKDEKGGNLYLPEKWIDSEDIDVYPVIRMEILNVSGQVGKDKGDGTGDKWTLADLYDEMRTKAAERFSVDKVDQIVEEVTVDFEMRGDTAENPELKKLESVLLYDQVGAINETIGLDVMLTVTELEWDAVREKVVSLKLSSGNEKAGRNVTGYNVQNKSIGWKKLSDEVPQEILEQVVDIIPEFTNPSGGGNYIPTSEKGAAGGVATLDNGGKVPASELPSYVDDVLEYASRSAFPATGESGKIYMAVDTGKTYRWSGSAYFELSTTAVTDNNPTLAWGQQAKIGTVAGTDLHVTMPANPNTDHYAWSDITNKPANYPGGCTGAAGSVAWANITGKPGSFYTLPLAANGTRGGIQVGYTQSGKNYPVQLSSEKAYVNVPWENTWRGIQNNLTSDSTTDSLSAAQGKALNDNKVAKAGDTMTGNLNVYRNDIYDSTVSVKNSRGASSVLMAGQSGNVGLYCNGYYNGSAFVSDAKYIVYRSTNGNIYLNGQAESVPWSGTNYPGMSALINEMDVESSPSEVGDYLIAQYAGGGTNYKNYYRRTVANVVNGTVVKYALGTNATHGDAFLRKDGTWQVPPGTYSLPLAASGTRGGIQLGYTQSGKNYPVQLDGEKAYVNVPWSDTVYSLPLAANGTRGGVQVGYTQSGKNYPVQLSGEKMYVNVPWTDTTYTEGSGLALSGNKFSAVVGAILDQLPVWSAVGTDSTYFIRQDTNGAAGSYGKVPFSTLWSYIAGKADGRYVNESGDSMTGDLTLQGNSTGGATPAIVFQRGSGSDNYTDVRMYNYGGIIYFQYRDNTTSNEWTTGSTLTNLGVFSGAATNINGTERHMQIRSGQFDISAQSAKTVSFATAFTNDCVGVCIHPTASFSGPTSISVNSKGKNGFTAYLYSTNGLGGTFVYTAFGY